MRTPEEILAIIILVAKLTGVILGIAAVITALIVMPGRWRMIIGIVLLVGLFAVQLLFPLERVAVNLGPDINPYETVNVSDLLWPLLLPIALLIFSGDLQARRTGMKANKETKA